MGAALNSVLISLSNERQEGSRWDVDVVVEHAATLTHDLFTYHKDIVVIRQSNLRLPNCQFVCDG